MSRLTVEKTYETKKKKDTSSDLFDAILSSQGSSSSSSGPPRRSPRKLNPHPVAAPQRTKAGHSPTNSQGKTASKDPFDFDEDEDDSPSAPSPPPLVKRREDLRKRRAQPSSPPDVSCLSAEESDEDSSSSGGPSSQGSVSGPLKAVRLTSPKRSPPSGLLMPPPKSPPLRLPSLAKAASAPSRVTAAKAPPAAPPKPKPSVRKPKGVYCPKGSWWDSDDEEEEDEYPTPAPSRQASRGRVSPAGDGVRGAPNTRPWAKAAEEPVRRSVQDAHQIHDKGEAVEHRGDLEYLLGTLADSSTPELKSLAVLQLARKALKPAFRQFLRSANCCSAIFRRLQAQLDESPSLPLPAALLVYLLSRDRLGIPPDDATLRLALALAKAPALPRGQSADYDKVRGRVWETLDKWREAQEAAANGAAFSFEVTAENLSAGFLATEALVFVSARASDPKLKDALLTHGVLQHSATSLAEIADTLKPPEDPDSPHPPDTLHQLRLAERHLRILEHCTLMAKDNQTFLVSYKNSLVIGAVGTLMGFFVEELEAVMVRRGEVDAEEAEELDPAQRLVLSAFTSFVRLICNIANNNQLACVRLGQSPRFLQRTLSLVTKVCPERLPPSKVFDTAFLVLSLLINLVEHNNANRRILMGVKVWVAPVEVDGESECSEQGAVEALCGLFGQHMARAAEVEESVDAELSKGAEEAAKAPGGARASEAALTATVHKAMAKAGAHMEEGIMGAYLALLLGFLVVQNEYLVGRLRPLLPGGSLKPCVAAMQQLADFMALTESAQHSARLPIQKVIDLFQKLEP